MVGMNLKQIWAQKAVCLCSQMVCSNFRQTLPSQPTCLQHGPCMLRMCGCVPNVAGHCSTTAGHHLPSKLQQTAEELWGVGDRS